MQFEIVLAYFKIILISTKTISSCTNIHSGTKNTRLKIENASS